MPLVQLTIAAPRHLEEELVERFLARPDWASGFTLYAAEGCSHHAEGLSARERVRGRARRVAVQIILEAEHARALLDHLRETLPKPDVAWWIAPVAEFGRLA
ncbi:MAG: DUF3240 family protein [Pseudomonadota bacterium]